MEDTPDAKSFMILSMVCLVIKQQPLIRIVKRGVAARFVIN
ncbi:MAG TPA: hypothetical protein PK345_03580 [Bacteroidales bacterium]|nr:hypothetical protein [Bacteroidales bacterium]